MPVFILLLFSSTRGIQIDEDVDIIYDDLIEELVAGRAELAGIDVSDFLRDGSNDDMETDKLTDLPENLQQLQQQLLQVRWVQHRHLPITMQIFLRPRENL